MQKVFRLARNQESAHTSSRNPSRCCSIKNPEDMYRIQQDYFKVKSGWHRKEDSISFFKGNFAPP
jgi:hypothetical protein